MLFWLMFTVFIGIVLGINSILKDHAAQREEREFDRLMDLDLDEWHKEFRRMR